MAKRPEPWLSADGLTHLIGARAGIITAIVFVKSMIGRNQYHHIPARHVRLKAARERELAASRETLAFLEETLRGYGEAIDIHRSQP